MLLDYSSNHVVGKDFTKLKARTITARLVCGISTCIYSVPTMPRYNRPSESDILGAFGNIVYLILGGILFWVVLIPFLLSQLPKFLAIDLANRAKEARAENRCKEEGENQELCLRIFSQVPLKSQSDNRFMVAGDSEASAACAEQGATATEVLCVKESNGKTVAWWEASAARPYIEEFCRDKKQAFVTCGYNQEEGTILPWWETDTTRNQQIAYEFETAFMQCYGPSSYKCIPGRNGYPVPKWTSESYRTHVVKTCAITSKPLVYCHQGPEGYVPYWEHYGFTEINVRSNDYWREKARLAFQDCAGAQQFTICAPGPDGMDIPYWATKKHRKGQEDGSLCNFSHAGRIDCRIDENDTIVPYWKIDPPYGPF